MCRCFISRRETPSTLKYDIDIQFFPGQLGRVALSQDANAITFHNQVIVLHRNLAKKTTVRRIKAGEMCINFSAAKIINRNYFDIVFLLRLVKSTQCIAANATITVNRYSDCHCKILWVGKFGYDALGARKKK